MDAAKSVAVGIASVSLMLGAGCSSQHTTSSSNPGLPPNGRPTAAALAAVDTVRIALTGTDCGGGPLDAGWPTTGTFNRSVCLRDADRARKCAFMTFTGRTGTGGAYRLVYVVDGRGGLRVSVVLAGPTGVLHREGWECPVPRQPLFAYVALGVPGRIIPSPVDKSCRHLAT